ncbi:hypothetical protein ACZ87_03654, partial [Candidatus Erwinia dacicola]
QIYIGRWASFTSVATAKRVVANNDYDHHTYRLCR